MRKLLFVLFALLMVSCTPINGTNNQDGYQPMRPGMGPGGMTWGTGSFDSVGEQIYFTGLNADGQRISYRGGPETGMMMQGYLSCASCHGPDAQGGEHIMHMQVMDAPDIRWESLSHEEEAEHNEADPATEEDDHHGSYDFEDFRRAVVDGEHPDGEALSTDMPRWQMSEQELRDLMKYLKSIQ